MSKVRLDHYLKGVRRAKGRHHHHYEDVVIWEDDAICRDPSTRCIDGTCPLNK